MRSALRHICLPLRPDQPQWARLQAALGLALAAVAWPASWLQVNPIGEFAFFPLWLGYILVVDALVLRRRGTSLLTRGPVAFSCMFLASVPLWWTFEGINNLTQNWYYLGDEEYSTLKYVVVASWSFSIVIPAVFETAELAGSFDAISRFGRGPVIQPSRLFLAAAIALGLLSLISLVLWPGYAYPVTWICLLLLLDPINYLRGHPSIIARLSRGDWRLVASLGAGALICGWFWEMWNYWAFPKWHYSIAFVDFVRVFEMPLLGYAGYLPFGLEAYTAYHFLGSLFRRAPRTALQIGPSDSTANSRTGADSFPSAKPRVSPAPMPEES